MRSIVGKADSAIGVANGIRESASSGHDEQRSLPRRGRKFGEHRVQVVGVRHQATANLDDYCHSQWDLFLAMIEAMPLTILSIGASEQAAATVLLRRYSDQDLTLTDTSDCT
jgi:hypothetical protein